MSVLGEFIRLPCVVVVIGRVRKRDSVFSEVDSQSDAVERPILCDGLETEGRMVVCLEWPIKSGGFQALEPFLPIHFLTRLFCLIEAESGSVVESDFRSIELLQGRLAFVVQEI